MRVFFQTGCFGYNLITAGIKTAFLKETVNVFVWFVDAQSKTNFPNQLLALWRKLMYFCS